MIGTLVVLSNNQNPCKVHRAVDAQESIKARADLSICFLNKRNDFAYLSTVNVIIRTHGIQWVSI